MGAVDSFDTIGRARWLERNWSIMRVALGFALSLTIIGLLVNSVYRLGTRAAGDSPGIMAFADSYRERPPADQSAPGQYEQLSAYSLVGGGSGAADSMSANVRAASPPAPVANMPVRSVVDIESAVSYRLREELVRLRQIPTKPDLAESLQAGPPSPPDRRNELIAAASRQPAPPPLAAAQEDPLQDVDLSANPSADASSNPSANPPLDAAAAANADASAAVAAPLLDPAASAALADGAPIPRAPRLRPDRPNQPNRIAAATPAPQTPAAAAPVAPGAPPAGPVSRFEIQLGALPSANHARNRWGYFQQRYPRILAGLGFRVMPVSTSSSTLYRLRVGPFNERVRADQICRALRAQGADCFVSVNN